MKILRLLALLGLFSGAADAQYIDIRVSVKVIVDPVSGDRPNGVTNQLFADAEDSANEWKAMYYRGYRYRITEVLEIGGPTQGGAEGPSKWFGQDPRDYPQPWLTFQSEINTDSRYLRRTDAVNVYITTPAQ